MAKNEGLVLLTLVSLLMLAIPAQVQASEFAVYNGLLFKIYYPSGWLVNQTGTVKQGNVTFQTQSNDTQPILVTVTWDPGNMSMDTKDFQNENGYVLTMVSNDSYYLLGQRAVVLDENNGRHEQMMFGTNVNGTSYTISYYAAIDHFLDHISQFNVMVASFSINGHVPFLYKEQPNNQTLYHKPHMFRSL